MPLLGYGEAHARERENTRCHPGFRGSNDNPVQYDMAIKYEVGKVEAAVEQLDWAIKLFLDHKAYVPAITLAGAAEEIIGRAVGAESAHQKLSKEFSDQYKIPEREVSQNYLNKAKNWLKHWTKMKDEKCIEIELEAEATQYIVRAIVNLVAHERSFTSETLRFIDWLDKNRKDLIPPDLLELCQSLTAQSEIPPPRKQSP